MVILTIVLARSETKGGIGVFPPLGSNDLSFHRRARASASTAGPIWQSTADQLGDLNRARSSHGAITDEFRMWLANCFAVAGADCIPSEP